MAEKTGDYVFRQLLRFANWLITLRNERGVWIACIPAMLMLLVPLFFKVDIIAHVLYIVLAVLFGFLYMMLIAAELRRQYRALVYHQQKELQQIRALRWQDFEVFVAEFFRRRGYEVVPRIGEGADGGIDMILHKDGRTVAVQCKQYRNESVDVKIVRELYGVMKDRGIAHGYVVTSGWFSDDAKAFAGGKDLELCLIDGERLFCMVQQLRPLHDDSVQDPAARPTMVTQILESALVLKPPPCPDCGATMFLKHPPGKRRFWGCANYPVCKGTRQLSPYDKRVVKLQAGEEE